MSGAADEEHEAVRAALAALGIRRLALAIHEASLPSAAEEDTGRGSAGSDEAGRFFAFVRALGFDAIQLGPQGETDPGIPSPYDAPWFSREPAAIAWRPLARGDRGPFPLAPDEVAALLADEKEKDGPRRAHAIALRALDRVRAAGASEAARALAARRDAFARRHAIWLAPYAQQELRAGGGSVARAERWALGQLLAHEQHEAVRERTRALGLALLGDVQIGASARDLAAWPAIFLPGYRLGAPPSRTNPEGQPWGYPVLAPPAAGAGRALAEEIVRARFAKLWDEFDGLRIDHPHGWIDPWVYRDDDPDPVHAVQHGARLLGAPAFPDHPALASHAIAGPQDLNPDPRVRRWDDDWVVRLAPEQIERYAARFDAIVALARERGRDPSDIVCEVLSTLPYPVACALERHGLGRFRVTQKASLDDPRDVYRSENAAPEDWIMVGTHDTAPLWRLADGWLRDGSAAARARRLAERLAPPGERREALGRAMAADACELALGHLAELFVGPARHVMVFFGDVFGFTEIYNEPGTVSESNWRLRLPASWQRDYAERRARGRALDLPRALALALRARGLDVAQAGLLQRLERASAGARA